MTIKKRLLGFLMFNCKLLHIAYRQKSKRFIKYYSKNAPRLKVGDPRIIVMHDGKLEASSCGGLGDRIHGILSIYNYCKQHNISIKVNFCVPYRLSDYIEPAEINWDIEPNEICTNIDDAITLFMPCVFLRCGRSINEETSIQYNLLDEYLRKYPNKQIHIYTNSHAAAHRDIYSKLFHEMFKPSQALENAIEWNKKRIGSNYIGAVFRFQNLLGDFYEGEKYPSLSQEDQELLISKSIDKLIDLHKNKHMNQKLLVTSDSRQFLDRLQTLSYIYTIPGKIVHLSFSSTKNFEVNLKSFIDLYMLSDAEKLYLFITPPMYHSGFAESASLINNRPYEVIRF